MKKELSGKAKKILVTSILSLCAIAVIGTCSATTAKAADNAETGSITSASTSSAQKSSTEKSSAKKKATVKKTVSVKKGCVKTMEVKGKIKSVKVKNKKIATAQKTKKNKVKITAKKVGKTTVTVKTTKKTYKITVNVKKKSAATTITNSTIKKSYTLVLNSTNTSEKKTKAVEHGAKVTSIKISDKSVVSAEIKKNVNDYSRVKFTAKEAGTATVTVKTSMKYKDKVYKRTYKYTITVQDRNNTSSSSASELDDLKYSYELKCINTPFSQELGISGVESTPVYLKTDNPGADRKSGFSTNIDVYLVASDGTEYRCAEVYQPYYDIEYTDESEWRVEGGYVFQLRFKKSGTFDILIQEEDPDTGFAIREGVIGSITVYDYDTYEDIWMNDIIAKTTTDDMSGKEKMTKIAAYLFFNGHYPQKLAAFMGAYFDTMVYDSSESPVILREIGEKIGYTLVAPSDIHGYAYSEEDDTYFTACPGVTYTDTDDIPMIDLSAL